MSEHQRRRLAAVMSADVVGFSRLMEQDEAGTLARLKVRRLNILNPLLTKHSGRIFKLLGDGVLAEFASPVETVACALAIQQAMAEANIAASGAPEIVIRIGINLGDVLVEGGDLYGESVNIASRLQELADPGGVLISGAVYEFVHNKLSATFEDAGSLTLKNIETPIKGWRAAPSAGRPTKPHGDPTPKASIAILPFVNLSSDSAQAYFSDGITEDIITELSRFRGLKVIARTSSFQYRDKAPDVRRVGRELGVAYLLEGSVRTGANQMRVTAQLVETSSGHHVWSERYDRPISDLFAVQDELTSIIVATLTGRLEDAEMKQMARRRTGSASAYDLLLRGIALLRESSAKANHESRKLFENAISLDPEFALAHAYLALALLVEHRYDNAPTSIKDLALDSALRAVKLDPNESRCHQFLAQAYRFRGEHDSAIAHFEHAISLNPNDANGIALLGSILGVAGRPNDGVMLLRRAMLLNPFHPDWYWNQLAVALYTARRYEEAIAVDRRNAKASEFWCLARMAACCAQLGRNDEAHRLRSEVLKRKPDFRYSFVKFNFRNLADAGHVREGLRKAGLPE